MTKLINKFTCDLKSSADDGQKVEMEISNNLDPKDALMAYVDSTGNPNAEEIKKILLEMYSQTRRSK